MELAERVWYACGASGMWKHVDARGAYVSTLLCACMAGHYRVPATSLYSTCLFIHATCKFMTQAQTLSFRGRGVKNCICISYSMRTSTIQNAA
jgi:hypothetical protein